MHYQNARFYFLSGTGNSYRAATWFAEMAAAQGAEAHRLPMGKPVEGPSEGCSPARFLLGLVFPTHGFTAPWHVLRFAVALPRGRGAHATVVAARAGAKLGPFFTPGLEGTAVWLVALLLTFRGYRVRGTLGLDMPSNWTAVHPGLGRPAAEAIVARGRVRAHRFMRRILTGGTALGGAVPLVLGLLLLPVSLGYLIYGRFFLGKLFFATNRCTGCGVCARSCPVEAIRMAGRKRKRPRWTFGCESCMRCMNFCPERAVEAGHSLGALLALATSLPVPTLVAAHLGLPDPAAGAGVHPLSWALAYVYFLGSLSLVYAGISALLWVPAVNTLFAWSTATRWFRRYREPDTELRDLLGDAGGREKHPAPGRGPSSGPGRAPRARSRCITR